jgi:uncharacterized membrane protein
MYKKKLDILLMIFSMIISVISLFYLPDTIPISYDNLGNVTRYGSKYELAFLLPIVIILMYLIITFIEHTLLAKHLRFITEFLKTYIVLVFSFENIKKILNVFNVKIPLFISVIFWSGMLLLSYDFKVNRISK